MIYLDNNATTKVLPEVLEAMLPYFDEGYFNPTSLAADLNGIREPLNLAVESLAFMLNASPDEFTLTSGATESNNWVLQSIASERLRTTGSCHILISAIEHPSIIETAEELSKRDTRIGVGYIPVDSNGVLDLDSLHRMIRPDTSLVSIMLANNESGVIQPVLEASKAVKNMNDRCLFHTDATQAIGKVPVDLQTLNAVDLLSLSSHKFYGPKGIGALFIRRRTNLESWMHGGSQQNGRRAGTENPALAAGLVKAIEFAQDNLHIHSKSIAVIRDDFETRITKTHPSIRIIGANALRLPNTSLVLLPDHEGEMIVHALLERGIATSTGSACANGSDRPSHVVTAMGIPYQLARNTLRFSLSCFTREADIYSCVNEITAILK